jgi:predicted ATPase
VGKSRLIKEFATRVEGSAQVLTGRCLPYGDGITFWPLAEIVRAASGILPDDAPAVAVDRIRRLLADRGTAESERAAAADRLAAAMGLEATQYPLAELFWGARKLLEALARERPLVAIIDDIHSAEATFLDLLDHVVDTAEDAPIVLLCSLLGPSRPGRSPCRLDGAPRGPVDHPAPAVRRRHRAHDR